MNERKLWELIAALGLAVTSLLLMFLLLGRSTVGATSEGAGTIPDIRTQGASFTVSGTVTCAVTGPISDVEVFVWNRDKGTGSIGDITDISGTYSVTMTEGSYDLIFNPPCGSECASKARKGITGPPDLTLNVVLSAGHSVSGTVYATGTLQTISNTAIYAFNRDTADGFGLPPTDPNGRYCIGLITGTYDLGFSPPPCIGLGPKTEVITVTQDMTLNVILPLGFTVTGRVTDGAGDPVSGTQIYARQCYTWTGYGFSPSNVNGYYTGTLPLGTFGIQFLPPAGRGLGPQTVTDVVSTTAGCPNTNLNVTLPAGLTVSGRVTCQGEPVKNVFVYADPAGPPPDCYGLDGVGVYTVDDGSYELPVVPGTYDIEFIPPQATGFKTIVISAVQVVTDISSNVDFCPVYLPIVMKGCEDCTAITAIQGTLGFNVLGCWVIKNHFPGYELTGELVDEIGQSENVGRRIIAWGRFLPVPTTCMSGMPFEVVSYKFLD